MPNPPLQPVPPVTYRRKQKWSAVASFLSIALEELQKKQNVESGVVSKELDTTTAQPQTLSEQRKQIKRQQHQAELEPLIAEYRREQRECKGEFKGMNCYNTLFVGRLAYEVTERKLLREMEVFGPVKDINIIKKKAPPNADGTATATATTSSVSSTSRGYAFVEFEHEDDLKRAYRAADGMRLDGKEIVVDVERGHTVPDWLPRRLGGGLGGTRLGGPGLNVTRPGRFDPHRPAAAPIMPPSGPIAPPHYQGPPSNLPSMGRGGGGGGPPPMHGGPPPSYGGYGGGAPMSGMGRGGGSDRYGGGGGGHYAGGGGAPPPLPPSSREWDRGRGMGGSDRGGGDYDRHKRRRSRSPPEDRRYGGSRRGRF
jgi:U1 small nuclear ribonucleoprotein 70kDa